MHKGTLILTFSHGEKELPFVTAQPCVTAQFARRLPLLFSPLGREGRVAPSEGKGVGVGEGWGEGMLIGPRNQ